MKLHHRRPLPLPGLTDELEAVDCNLCDTPPPPDSHFVSQGFQVVKCPQCGVLRVSPRLKPKALQAYYSAPYWVSHNSVVRGYSNYPGDERNIRRTFKRRMAYIRETFSELGAWLDVGCASGFLLAEAEALGYAAIGIEWSQAARENAPAAIRSKIMHTTLQAAVLPSASMAGISFWDYLEHSPHPRRDLEKAAQLLKPGGFLSIILPVTDSWLARVMGPRWEEYKKPQEHLYFFTSAQLTRLLQLQGLRLVGKRWEGKYASLGFAFNRFQPGDGWLYYLMQGGWQLVKALGWKDKVVYVNPRDKLHLLFRKEAA